MSNEEGKEEEEPEEEAVIPPPRGTELSDAVEDFHFNQRRRIAYWLKIITRAKMALEREYGKDPDVAPVILEFKEDLKKRRSLEIALEHAEMKLSKIGKWEKVRLYFEFHRMIKKKISPEKIIDSIKPILLQLKKWSQRTERLYSRYLETEREVMKEIKAAIERRDIWINWLSQVRGIDLLLAAQIIGGFESALEPEETLGKHFENPSQMNAFAGLDIDPKTGKAWKKKRGQKLHYNERLRSILIGRLGSSFLRQNSQHSGYRRLYDEAKEKLIRRFEKEGVKIVPSAKLPVDSAGRHYEPKGMISEAHLHQMALRIPVKMFICHLWEEIRRSEDLPSGKPYVIEVLGHPEESYIPPIRDKFEQSKENQIASLS